METKILTMKNRNTTDLEAQMEGRDRAKVEDAGSSPAGISRCRSRPIAGRERAKLETWVQFPAFAPNLFATTFGFVA